MSRNKKGVYRERKPQDLADIVKTIKIRQSHWKNTEGTPARLNFSGFVGDLMEDFFQRKVLDQFVNVVADLKKLSSADLIAIIGNEVDPARAMACLTAWLDGKPIPPLKISQYGSDLYKSVQDSLTDTVAEDYTHSESARMLDYLREFYFYEKAVHLRMYDMSHLLVAATQERADQEEWRADMSKQLNEMVNMEYAPINTICLYSAHLRFSIYDCWRSQKLRTRAIWPGWTVNAKDRLEAMNKSPTDTPTKSPEKSD